MFPVCDLCNSRESTILFCKDGFNILRCLSCGLVYVDIRLLDLKLKMLYSFESNYQTSFLDESSEASINGLRNAYKDYEMVRRYKEHGCILDIGCSVGFFLKVAKECGWYAYGLELSNDTAEIARKRYGLNVVTGTLDEISFEQKFFDIVTLWDVIEHSSNPRATMSIVRKILKDDGIVVLSTPNIDGLFPSLSYKIAKIIDYWPHPEPPYHLFQFSKSTIKKLLTQTGFELINIVDTRIPLTYSFGNPKGLIKTPKKLLYSAIFALIATVGPIVHSGDSMIVFAKKT